MDQNVTRSDLSIPEETDRVVRTFVVRNGAKKADPCRAVKPVARVETPDKAGFKAAVAGKIHHVPSWPEPFRCRLGYPHDS